MKEPSLLENGTNTPPLTNAPPLTPPLIPPFIGLPTSDGNIIRNDLEG
jgi:hypothetical protein